MTERTPEHHPKYGGRGYAQGEIRAYHGIISSGCSSFTRSGRLGRLLSLQVRGGLGPGLGAGRSGRMRAEHILIPLALLNLLALGLWILFNILANFLPIAY
jgi:hypothetical protein